MGAPDLAYDISLLGHTDQGDRGDGVRVLDLANPFAPRGVGAFVPPAPERLYDTRPNRPRVVQSCDVFVDRDAVMYVTDDNAGPYVLQYEGGS